MNFSSFEIVLSKHIASVLSAETKSKRKLFVTSIVYGSNTFDNNEEDSLRIGDVIVSINSVKIDCLKLDYINETLSNVVSPVTLVVHRFIWDAGMISLLRDARTSVWIQQYCKLPQASSSLLSGSNVETLIYLWSMIDYVRSVVSYLHYMSQPVDDIGFLILSFRECVGYFEPTFLESIGTVLPADVQETLDCVVRTNLEQMTSPELCSQLSIALTSLHRWLTEELQEKFYVPFQASTTAARLCGWLSQSPLYVHLDLTNLLPVDPSHNALWSFLYLFILTKCRHLARLTSVVEEISVLMLQDPLNCNTSEKIESSGWKLVKEGAMTAFYKSDMYELLLSELKSNGSEGSVSLRSGALSRLFRSSDLPSHLTKTYCCCVTDITPTVQQQELSSSCSCLSVDDLCAFSFSTTISADYGCGSADATSYVAVSGAASVVPNTVSDTVFISPLSTSSSYCETDDEGRCVTVAAAADSADSAVTSSTAVTNLKTVKYEVVYRSPASTDFVMRSCIDARLAVDQPDIDPNEVVNDATSSLPGSNVCSHAAVLLPFCAPNEDYITLNSATKDDVKLFTFVVTVRSGERLYGCSLLRRAEVATLDWSLAINYAGVHKIVNITKSGTENGDNSGAGGRQQLFRPVKRDSHGVTASVAAPVTGSVSTTTAALSDLSSRLYTSWQTALAVGSSLPIVPIFKDDFQVQTVQKKPSTTAATGKHQQLHQRQKEPKPIKHTRHHSYSSGIGMKQQQWEQHAVSFTTKPKSEIKVATSSDPQLPTGQEFDRSQVMGACGVCVYSNKPDSLGLLRKLLSLAYSDCNVDDGSHSDDDFNRRLLAAFNTRLQIPASPCAVGPRFGAVYESLSPRNLTTLFLCCLLEYKIVLRSSLSFNISVEVGEYLLRCLQPLRYCHLYAPLLQASVSLDLLQCPTPFLIGSFASPASTAAPVVPPDVVVVDIDQDRLTVPPSLQPGLNGSGDALEAALSRCLRPLLHSLDSVDPTTQNAVSSDEPVNLCQQFVSELLSGVSNCVHRFSDADGQLVIVFDELKFVKLKCTSGADVEPAFLALLLRSQCFTEYVTESHRMRRGVCSNIK